MKLQIKKKSSDAIVYMQIVVYWKDTPKALSYLRGRLAPDNKTRVFLTELLQLRK